MGTHLFGSPCTWHIQWGVQQHINANNTCIIQQSTAFPQATLVYIPHLLSSYLSQLRWSQWLILFRSSFVIESLLKDVFVQLTPVLPKLSKKLARTRIVCWATIERPLSARESLTTSLTTSPLTPTYGWAKKKGKGLKKEKPKCGSYDMVLVATRR